MTQDGNKFGRRGIKPPNPPSPTPVVSDRSPEESGSLNAAFIATVAAVFVAVGSGTFFFLNGGPSFLHRSSEPDKPAYVSIVDQKCSKGWIKNTLNTDQMHCYLTASKSRLCDPKEHAHLMAVFERFQDDYSDWSARHFAASLGTIGKANLNMVEIGTSTADLERSMNDPNVSDEERQKKAERVEGVMGDVLDGPNKIMAEHVNTILYYELEDDVTKLASAGLLSEADFEWSMPDFVKKGLKAVKKVHSTCVK
ncbi:hypothetical protein BH10PSE7_BH10PSE7_28400 [soil metagenome]